MRKVMIADDEETILKGLRLLFKWQEYGLELVAEAMDGQEAVLKASMFRPDVILMDINMPKMNGLNAIREIKSLLPDSVFIIISGYDDFALVREALQLQVDDYLLKPIDFNELAETINRTLAENEHGHEKEKTMHKEELSSIGKMFAYIEDHLYKKLSLKELSEAFHFNPNYLSQYFKKQTGMNFSEYVASRRVEKAKAMLETTDMSIGDIAASVGIQDYRTFSKLFKRYTNQSPSLYRMGTHSLINDMHESVNKK